jgi:hypothetical protein
MKNEYNVNIAEISVNSELLQFEDAIELSEDSILKISFQNHGSIFLKKR